MLYFHYFYFLLSRWWKSASITSNLILKKYLMNGYVIVVQRPIFNSLTWSVYLFVALFYFLSLNYCNPYIFDKNFFKGATLACVVTEWRLWPLTPTFRPTLRSSSAGGSTCWPASSAVAVGQQILFYTTGLPPTLRSASIRKPTATTAGFADVQTLKLPSLTQR